MNKSKKVRRRQNVSENIKVMRWFRGVVAAFALIAIGGLSIIQDGLTWKNFGLVILGVIGSVFWAIQIYKR